VERQCRGRQITEEIIGAVTNIACAAAFAAFMFGADSSYLWKAVGLGVLAFVRYLGLAEQQEVEIR
jgi:hypothetical protein